MFAFFNSNCRITLAIKGRVTTDAHIKTSTAFVAAGSGYEEEEDKEEDEEGMNCNILLEMVGMQDVLT